MVAFGRLFENENGAVGMRRPVLKLSSVSPQHPCVWVDWDGYDGTSEDRRRGYKALISK